MVFETLIDVDGLRDLLGNPQVAIFDCRCDLMTPGAGRIAYLRGHIPGARYVDLGRDLSGPITASSGRHPLPAADAFAQRLGQFGVGNDTQVIAYDDSNGSFAARLWWMMHWLGHRAAAVLDGGFKAWTAAAGALQTGDAPALGEAARTAHFSPRLQQGVVIGTAELIDTLRNPRGVLVDARAAERFAGAIEPIDAVAGHVPGAVNHPFTSNLDASAQFLPPDTLRERWRERLAGAEPRDLVAMCGSGVTACHNLLALEVAGLPGAKLYAGSWSEWIRDPGRPVARGSSP